MADEIHLQEFTTPRKSIDDLIINTYIDSSLENNVLIFDKNNVGLVAYTEASDESKKKAHSRKLNTKYSLNSLSVGDLMVEIENYIDTFSFILKNNKCRMDSTYLCSNCIRTVGEVIDGVIRIFYEEIEQYETEVNNILQDDEILPKNRCDISEEGLTDDITNLMKTCSSRATELNSHDKLWHDLKRRSKELDILEEKVLLDIRKIDHEAKIVNEVVSEQTQKVFNVFKSENEANHKKVNILSAEFTFVLNKKPLINGFRLSHRLKGDLKWEELNIAWAEASRLLLFCMHQSGFSSKKHQLVYISECSKVIDLNDDRREYDLGDMSTENRKKRVNSSFLHSIRSFSVLLGEFLSFSWNHVKNKVEHKPPPFGYSNGNFGGINVVRIDGGCRDDVWQSLIFMIACDLHWLKNVTQHLISCN